jgi:translation elongation factor EF-Tu-like GTPase
MKSFRASISFLKTEAGGRSDYVSSGYCSAITFREKHAQHSAQFIFEDRDRVLPGEECEAKVTLIAPEFTHSAIRSGTTFEVCEGLKTVGKGTILEVL